MFVLCWYLSPGGAATEPRLEDTSELSTRETIEEYVNRMVDMDEKQTDCKYILDTYCRYSDVTHTSKDNETRTNQHQEHHID